MVGIFCSLCFIMAFVSHYMNMEPLQSSDRPDQSSDDMFIYFALHDNE